LSTSRPVSGSILKNLAGTARKAAAYVGLWKGGGGMGATPSALTEEELEESILLCKLLEKYFLF